MEFFYLIVFGLVYCGLFGYLVVKKSHISLVFGCHDLLFGFDLMEGLMQVFNFIVVDIA